MLCVSCVIPLCLVKFVNIASCYNVAWVVQIACILCQAVVTEHAMSLQTKVVLTFGAMLS